VWRKVGFVPHPIFFRFSNAFISFIEYIIGCGKMSTLRHTLQPCKYKGLKRISSMYETKYGLGYLKIIFFTRFFKKYKKKEGIS